MCQTKTEDQVADIYTKGLNATKFVDFRKQLSITIMAKLRESILKGSVKNQAPPLSLSRNFSLISNISPLLSF